MNFDDEFFTSLIVLLSFIFILLIRLFLFNTSFKAAGWPSMFSNENKRVTLVLVVFTVLIMIAQVILATQPNFSTLEPLIFFRHFFVENPERLLLPIPVFFQIIGTLILREEVRKLPSDHPQRQRYDGLNLVGKVIYLGWQPLIISTVFVVLIYYFLLPKI